jgi:dTDP-4-amino-4,6-dideoxygalactose transaminase/ribosomal protein S18 acetylase RimI-like enzyme
MLLFFKMNTIPLFKVFMSDDACEITNKTLRSGFISQGSKVEEFENELKKVFDYDKILTVNSATSGLTLAVRLLNLASDDEIISTPMTCFATTSAILAVTNAKIVWTDVDKSCHMDLDDLERKITNKTKVIMVVNWGGTIIDLEKIHDIISRKNKNIMIIQDCAHSFYAEYKNKKYNSEYNTISVYSFQAIKHLTTADGGCIILPNDLLYQRAKLLRWYGLSREYKNKKDFRIEHDIPESGFKFHMNDLNASIGLGNLPFIKDNINHVRKLATIYDKHLSNIVEIAKRPVNSNSSFWLYTIFIKEREQFIQWMRKCSITVSQVHTRNDRHSCVKQYQISLPQLDIINEELVCIPIGWWVTIDQVYYIIECIKQFVNKTMIRTLHEDDRISYCNLLSQLLKINCDVSDNEWVKFLHKNQMNTIIVCEFNGVVVGTGKVFIKTKIKDPVAHIEDIVVDFEYRGKGFGKKIINYLKEFAKQNNVYKTVLSASLENKKFYESCGFQKEGNEFVCRRIN